MSRGLSRAAAFGRRHALFLVLLGAGALLREAAFFAYRPALFIPDSLWYLTVSEDLEPRELRPVGYSGFLRLLPLENELAVVPFVQHLVGLAIACLLYALLVRLRVRRWLAALATAPVLLDGYPLNIEQQILSETVFQFLLVSGCCALLWHRPPGIVATSLAGVVFAAAVLTRTVGVFALVPATIAVLALAGPRARARLLATGALLLAFAAPLVAYAAWFHSEHGEYALSSYEGRYLYGRVVRFADCTRLALPEHERILCPGREADALWLYELIWSRVLSPVEHVVPPPGTSENEVAADFARRVIRAQPGDYARTVGADFLRGFAPTKTGRVLDYGVRQWQFQRTFPTRPRTEAAIRAHGDKRGTAEPELAPFLSGYQRFVFTPGPLLAAGLVVSVAAVLGVGRARRSGLRPAVWLLAGAGVAVVLGSLLVTPFSWRYQLPYLVLVPPAAAIALTALAYGRPDPAPDSVNGR